MDYAAKAKALVKKMILNEKVGQLAQRPWGFTAYVRLPKGIHAKLSLPNGYRTEEGLLCADEQTLRIYKV